MLALSTGVLTGLSIDDLVRNGVTRAEVLSGDMRRVMSTPGTVVHNVKLGWSSKINWSKSIASRLSASYDLKKNRNFIKDLSLSSDFESFGFQSSCSFTQEFADGGLDGASLNLQLSTPVVAGMRVEAEYDTCSHDHITSLALPVGPYRCGDICKLAGKTEWLGGAKAMKYAASAAFQPASKYVTKLKASATHAVEPGGPGLSYEAGVEQGVGKGRSVSATCKNSKSLALEYVDAAFDDQATWTLTANMPLDAGAKDAFVKPKVFLKRKWAF